MAWTVDELVQRGHNFAIVDEVDSILIDEARTPLIISGPADAPAKWYSEFAKLVRRAQEGRGLRGRREEAHRRHPRPGIEKVEDWLGIENLYESVNTPLVGYLNNAIKAKELFQRDKDYVVQTARCSSSTSTPAACSPVAATTRACTRPSRPRRGWRSRREPDPGHDHPAELLPHVRQALGHDRHGHDRGRRVQLDLQARRGADPDQPADDPQGPGRPHLPHRGAKFAPSSTTSQERHEKGQPVLVGTASVEKSEYLSSAAEEAAGSRTRCSTPSTTSGGGDRRRGRPQGRGHRGHQHGRPRHRHHARRQRRVPRRPALRARGLWTRWRPRRSTRRPGTTLPKARSRSRPSTRRSPSSAGCTCSAPSATSPAASTTSCAVVPAARATRASPGSTSRSRTT
jgi:hypothetical protein